MMIPTQLGPIDESMLTRKEGVDEDDRVRTEWVQYWAGETLVYHAISVTLKDGQVIVETNGTIH